MTALVALWLPILVAAVLVFVASSLIHMFTPWHVNDFAKLPHEDKVMDALRGFSIAPGDYLVPGFASQREMASPEFAEKTKRGPVMKMTVLPSGETSMARSLVLWFIYCLVVGLLAAYITGQALPMGAASKRVFQFAGATAFIGYAAALWQATIWYNRAWTATLRSTIDGLLYAIITAVVFVWLWPG